MVPKYRYNKLHRVRVRRKRLLPQLLKAEHLLPLDGLLQARGYEPRQRPAEVGEHAVVLAKANHHGPLAGQVSAAVC